MANNLSPYTRIVFDTNVLISTFVFSGRAAAEVYDFCALHLELFTSEKILSELGEVLARDKFRLSLEQRNRIIKTIRERHIAVFPTNALPTDSVDPDDYSSNYANLDSTLTKLITLIIRGI